MKTNKMSLANIQGRLSRNEMKNISGGMSMVCSCNGGNTATIVCGYSSYSGYLNCSQSTTNFMMHNCGSAGGGCATGSLA